MGQDNKEYSISILCEFIDKNIEREFFNYYIGRVMRYIRPILLILGSLNMLFLIPDYFLVKNLKTFLDILVNRSTFFILILILFIFIKNIKNYVNLAYMITIYEFILSISFLLIFIQYGNSRNFSIQAFGVMVIILGIFLIPNKWMNSLIASSFISIAFFILSVYYSKQTQFAEYSAGIVYILIVLVISSISAFQNGYFNRKQYAYSKELLDMSITDPLTGIYNRGKFNEDLKKWIDYSKRYRASFSVAIFDLDNFKRINDTYGHLVGDKVIVGTVNVIKNSIRQTDVFARWGGEEFVLLFPNTNRQQAIELTERLRVLISHNKFEKVGSVTCSFGLATFKENDNADSLINSADELLYTAKKGGKNRVAN
ncbi:GGDEF domain-containing protein [Clostridium sp. WILCCON 0269]|uniref:GGDEF domain-containing protein n=1 Tax=Candidatus Clostridium eludens TaxID=3381663 RepID=A0ABW8SSC0_9CLOT